MMSRILSITPRFGLALIGTRADNKDFSRPDMALLRHLIETNRLPNVPSLEDEAYRYNLKAPSEVQFSQWYPRDVPEALRTDLPPKHDGFALIYSAVDNDRPQHMVVLHGTPHGASTPCTITPRDNNPHVIDVRA